MSRFVQRGGCSLALGLFVLSAQAEKAITSFEESEGFISGALATGHADWTGTAAGAAPTHLFVTTEEFYQGTQSLVAKNTSGKYNFTQSPDLFSKDASEVSFFFKNIETDYLEPDQPLARWEVSYGQGGDATSHRIIMLLRYTSEKALHINISSPNDASIGKGNRNILSRSNFKLNDWNELTMSFDFPNKMLTILINGAPVSNAVELNPESVSTSARVTGVRFATPPRVASGATYYDMVSVRSESSASVSQASGAAK